MSKCYHCGNCSATCPFSTAGQLFPRKSMRYLQIGLEKKLEGTLEPWLCYYCGECSEECPREAEPGETMMSMRRWLTSRSDFTGIPRLFYRSWKWELGAILLELTYDTQPPWPVAPDGAGHSLVLARPSYGEADPHAEVVRELAQEQAQYRAALLAARHAEAA